jgi:predicted AAA+ superfamily ATPase
VLIELERRRMGITYIRTPRGHEVDYLARSPSGEVHLIQVCADATDANVLEREVRALKEAGELYPNASKHILTLTRDALPATVPAGMSAQTVYEWMLTQTA